MAWAFWAAPVEEVFESPSAVMELNQMVDTIEEVTKVKFIGGHNPDVDCIRLSLDPVIASHRPLIYYLVKRCLLCAPGDTLGSIFLFTSFLG